MHHSTAQMRSSRTVAPVGGGIAAGTTILAARLAISSRVRARAAAVAGVAEDKWIQENVLGSAVPSGDAPSGLSALRAASTSALATMRMPTTRNEEYRFTDVAPLTSAGLSAADGDAPVDASFLESLRLPEAAGTSLVLVNGKLRPELSDASKLPAGVFVGGSGKAPADVLRRLGELSNSRGGPFAVINGALASDAVVVALPAGARLEQPLHIVHVATSAGAKQAAAGGARAAAAPRLLVHLGRGADAEIVEEYVSAAAADGGSGGATAVFSVSEAVLDEGASLRHGYVEREGRGAAHFKASLVDQAERSSYSLVEARAGGGLVRHDLGIAQGGPETTTRMRHFLLAGADQLQDLHSKLVLDHPRGEADQLHKCIVAHASGRGVFDGNVRVNRLAQKTDAGQLSRNLLLAPRATVNVKPNLQIIADDVKCTHGAAISDLSEEELFYFRARGIAADAARQALVRSFGSEVVGALRLPGLVARVQADVVAALRDAEASASS